MQKFDTPAPISVVLDIPAGRIRFIAADRADTAVEVLPAFAPPPVFLDQILPKGAFEVGIRIDADPARAHRHRKGGQIRGEQFHPDRWDAASGFLVLDLLITAVVDDDDRENK